MSTARAVRAAAAGSLLATLLRVTEDRLASHDKQHKGSATENDFERLSLSAKSSLASIYATDPSSVLRLALRLVENNFEIDNGLAAAPPELLLAYSSLRGNSSSVNTGGSHTKTTRQGNRDRLHHLQCCLFGGLAGVLNETAGKVVTSTTSSSRNVDEWSRYLHELSRQAIVLLLKCSPKHSQNDLENALVSFVASAVSPDVAPSNDTSRAITDMVLNECKSGEAPHRGIIVVLSNIANNLKHEFVLQPDATHNESVPQFAFVSRVYVKIVPTLGSTRTATDCELLAKLFSSLAECAISPLQQSNLTNDQWYAHSATLGSQTEAIFKVFLDKWASHSKMSVRAATARAMAVLSPLLLPKDLNAHGNTMLTWLVQQLETIATLSPSDVHKTADMQLVFVEALTSILEFSSRHRRFEHRDSMPMLNIPLALLHNALKTLLRLRTLFLVQSDPNPAPLQNQRTELLMRAGILRCFDLLCFVAVHDSSVDHRVANVDAGSVTLSTHGKNAAANTILSWLVANFRQVPSSASSAAEVMTAINSLSILQHLVTRPNVAALLLRMDAAPMVLGALRPLFLVCDPQLEGSAPSQDSQDDADNSSRKMQNARSTFPLMYTLRWQLCQVAVGCARARLIFARSRKTGPHGEILWSESRLQDGASSMMQFVIHQCGFTSDKATEASFLQFLDSVGKTNTSWWAGLIGGSKSDANQHGVQPGSIEQVKTIDSKPLQPYQLGRLAARLLVHLGRQVGTPMLKIMLTELIRSHSEMLAACSTSPRSSRTGENSAIIEALVLFCERDDAEDPGSVEVGQANSKDYNEHLRSLIKSDFANGKSGSKKRALLFGRLLVLALVPFVSRVCLGNEQNQVCRNALKLLTNYLPFLIGARSRKKFAKKREWAAVLNKIEDAQEIAFKRPSESVIAGNNSDDILSILDEIFQDYVGDPKTAEWMTDVRSTFELTLFRSIRNRDASDYSESTTSRGTPRRDIAFDQAYTACIVRLESICLKHCADTSIVSSTVQRLIGLSSSFCSAWHDVEVWCSTASLSRRDIMQASKDGIAVFVPSADMVAAVRNSAVVEVALVRGVCTIVLGSDHHAEIVTSTLASQLIVSNRKLKSTLSDAHPEMGNDGGSRGQKPKENDIKRALDEDRAMVTSGQKQLQHAVNEDHPKHALTLPVCDFDPVGSKHFQTQLVVGLLRWMLCAATTTRLRSVGSKSEAESIGNALLFGETGVLRESLRVDEYGVERTRHKGQICPILRLRTVQALRALVEQAAYQRSAETSENATSFTFRDLLGPYTDYVLRLLLDYMSEAARQCNLRSSESSSSTRDKAVLFNSTWASINCLVVAELLPALSKLWTTYSAANEHLWTRLVILQCGAHLLDLSALAFAQADTINLQIQSSQSNNHDDLLSPSQSAQSALRLAHDLLSTLSRLDTMDPFRFFHRFQTVASNSPTSHNLVVMLTALQQNFEHCFSDSPKCDYVRRNAVPWVSFLVPMAIGHEDKAVRSCAAGVTISLVDCVSRGSPLQNTSKDTLVAQMSRAYYTTDDVDNFSLVEKLLHRDGSSIFFCNTTGDDQQQSVNSSDAASWAVGFDELCRVLCASSVQQRHKAAAATCLRLFLQVKQPPTQGDPDGEAVAHVVRRIASVIRILHCNSAKRNHVMLLSPISEGFLHWITAGGVRQRFPTAVATLMQTRPAITCQNQSALPFEARFLLRAIACGPRAIAEQQKRPVSLFKKLLEILTNVLNTTEPFGSGAAAAADMQLHLSLATLHILEDVFAPLSWRDTQVGGSETDAYLSSASCLFTAELLPVVEHFARRHYIPLMSTLIMGIACVNVKFFQHKVQTQVNSEVVPEDTTEGKSHSAAANQSPDIEATTEAAHAKRSDTYRQIVDAYFRVVSCVLIAADKGDVLEAMTCPAHITSPVETATGTLVGSVRDGLAAAYMEDFIDFSATAMGESVVFCSALQQLRSEESFHVGIQSAVYALIASTHGSREKIKVVAAVARQFGKHLIEQQATGTPETPHQIASANVFSAITKFLFHTNSVAIPTHRAELSEAAHKNMAESTDEPGFVFDATWNSYVTALLRLSTESQSPIVRACCLRASSYLILTSQGTSSECIQTHASSLFAALLASAKVGGSDYVQAAALAALADCAASIPLTMFDSHFPAMRQRASLSLTQLRSENYVEPSSSRISFAAISTIGSSSAKVLSRKESGIAGICLASLVRRCALRLYDALILRCGKSSKAPPAATFATALLEIVTHVRADSSLTRSAAIRAIQTFSLNFGPKSTTPTSAGDLVKLLQDHLETVAYDIGNVGQEATEYYFQRRDYVVDRQNASNNTSTALQLQRLELRSHDKFLDAFVSFVSNALLQESETQKGASSAASVLLDLYRQVLRSRLTWRLQKRSSGQRRRSGVDSSAFERRMQEENTEWEVVRGSAAVALALGCRRLRGTKSQGNPLMDVALELEALLSAPSPQPHAENEYAKTRAATALGILCSDQS